jgi:hypothetical protein
MATFTKPAGDGEQVDFLGKTTTEKDKQTSTKATTEQTESSTPSLREWADSKGISGPLVKHGSFLYTSGGMFRIGDDGVPYGGGAQLSSGTPNENNTVTMQDYMNMPRPTTQANIWDIANNQTKNTSSATSSTQSTGDAVVTQSKTDPTKKEDPDQFGDKTGDDYGVGGETTDDAIIGDAPATETEEGNTIPDGMDYEVPEASDAFVPEGSGTADVEQTTWDVTDEQTVAGQFEDLYDRDSPIFEQARQRAIRQHLASGGQNSAMAAGFGEAAAMDKVFQIAQADAATYARSAEFNAAMANQYSLAEQRFIQNALLSEQAFQQAKSLQTQRIAAQLESIVLDYKGRSALMDKELDIWQKQAAKQFEYDMSKLSFQLEGEKQMINMQALANFYSNGFASVMQIAGNPNLSAKQSKAAMEEGMAWFNTQLNAFRAILYGNTTQTSTGQDFLNYNWATGENEGTVPTDGSGYPNWGDWNNYPGGVINP